MNIPEIALNLTLKALDLNYIPKDNYTHDSDEGLSKAIELNAKNISDFYNKLLENIDL